MVYESIFPSKEEWRPVVGYEDKFLVSSHGRVKRFKTRYGNPCNKFMKLNLATTGYYRVSVSDGPRYVPYVHTLVAEAFIGPRPPGLHINHKDADKLNNRPENLEYITCRENLRHAAGLGRSGIKLDAKRVCEIRQRHRELGRFDLVAKEYGMHPSHIGRVVKGRYWGDIK